MQMTLVQAAMWVHGNTVQVEFPKRLAATDADADSSGFRRGWGTLFRGGDPDPVRASNWFHIPIPTPALLDDAKPLLKRVFVLYRTSPEQSRARLTSLHLYDGTNPVAAFDDLVGFSGDHSARVDVLNTWEIAGPLFQSLKRELLLSHEFIGNTQLIRYDVSIVQTRIASFPPYAFNGQASFVSSFQSLKRELPLSHLEQAQSEQPDIGRFNRSNANCLFPTAIIWQVLRRI